MESGYWSSKVSPCPRKARAASRSYPRHGSENYNQSGALEYAPRIHNAERRARAESLGKLRVSNRTTLYVEAAGPQYGKMVAAVTTPYDGVLNSATLRTRIATQEEEAAIALTIASKPRAIILTDSQEACKHLIQGNVFKLTHQIS